MGLLVPIPTLPPATEIGDFSILQGAVNIAIELAVAVPSLVMLLHGLSWLTCVWLVWVWLWAFAAGGCNPLGGTATTPELSAPCST